MDWEGKRDNVVDVLHSRDSGGLARLHVIIGTKRLAASHETTSFGQEFGTVRDYGVDNQLLTQPVALILGLAETGSRQQPQSLLRRRRLTRDRRQEARLQTLDNSHIVGGTSPGRADKAHTHTHTRTQKRQV